MKKKFTGQKHDGADRSAPYPVSRLAPATELVDLAAAIAQADQTIQSHVSGKLDLIARQIRVLQQQAHEILQQAERDQQLHRASCQSQRIIGQIYYLYERNDEQPYFSRLSPSDWRGNPPHPFRGAYRLEQDMSWTQIEDDVSTEQFTATS